MTSKKVYTKSKYTHYHKRKLHRIIAKILETSIFDDDIIINKEEQESLAISNGFKDINKN